MASMRLLLLLVLALSVIAAPASRAATAARIEVSPQFPDAGTKVRIRIDGEWPDACVPELRSVRLDGQDIVLTATVPGGNCGAESRTYQIDSEQVPTAALKLRRNGIYRIRFEVQRHPGSEPELQGFRLLYASNDSQPPFVPETGFWWPERGGEFDHAGPGLGVQFEAQASTLSVSAFGYDSQGQSNWYFGAGAISGRTAQIELSQLAGGAGPFEAYRAPAQATSVGSLHVELLTPSRAILWFVQPRGNAGGLRLQPVSMVRFRFAQEAAEAWLGRWVVLAERDDGYPTRRIDFVTIERSADGFILLDADGEHRLACRNEITQPNSPPFACSLLVTGDDKAAVEFRDIALGELRGWTGAGERIVALKLKR
jgi:hypothetical protein